LHSLCQRALNGAQRGAGYPELFAHLSAPGAHARGAIAEGGELRLRPRKSALDRGQIGKRRASTGGQRGILGAQRSGTALQLTRALGSTAARQGRDDSRPCQDGKA
jgi:hypothetical protein